MMMKAVQRHATAATRRETRGPRLKGPLRRAKRAGVRRPMRMGNEYDMYKPIVAMLEGGSQYVDVLSVLEGDVDMEFVGNT